MKIDSNSSGLDARRCSGTREACGERAQAGGCRKDGLWRRGLWQSQSGRPTTCLRSVDLVESGACVLLAAGSSRATPGLLADSPDVLYAGQDERHGQEVTTENRWHSSGRMRPITPPFPPVPRVSRSEVRRREIDRTGAGNARSPTMTSPISASVISWW
jgi:hypothetical protein